MGDTKITFDASASNEVKPEVKAEPLFKLTKATTAVKAPTLEQCCIR